MNKLASLLLLFLATACATQSAVAQRRAKASLTGGVQTSIPLGQFKNKYNENPVGLGASLTAPLFRNSPLHVGVGFGWNRLNRDEQDVFAASDDGVLSTADIDITTNRYTYDVHARLSPFNGRFQPFGEVLAGWSTYNTKSEMNTKLANGELIETKGKIHNSTGWNYGWGAGLHFRIAPHIYLEGKVQRTYSTKSSFVNHEELNIDPLGDVSYELTEGKPEFLTIQAGLTIKF